MLEDFTPTEREERRIFELGWRRRCIEYVVNAESSLQFSQAELEAVYARSFATWLDVDCGGSSLDFQVRLGPEPGLCDVPEYVPNGGANANTMAFVADWSRRGHAGGAFALTTTWFDTTSGEIFDADMELNQEFWTWADCPPEGCDDGRVDLENTLTHELGHFFGLAHSPDDNEATMWACADEGETLKRDLAPDDSLGICDAYPPGSLPLDCNFTPRGGFDPACKVDRTGCGCTTPGTGLGTPWPAFGLFLLVCWRRSKGARARDRTTRANELDRTNSTEPARERYARSAE